MLNLKVLKMNRESSEQSGFTAVEGLLVILILSVVGFGSYYVWHSHKKTPASNTGTHTVVQTPKTPTTAATPAPASSAYAGWKTATLTYEKLSYQYPSDWTVDDQSMSFPKSENSCAYPGVDRIYLTSPSKEQVVLQTGIDCIGDGGALSFGSLPISSLGQNLYLAFEANSGTSGTPSAPSYACLAKNTDPESPIGFTSKNIFSSNSTPANSFCYYPYMFYTAASGDII